MTRKVDRPHTSQQILDIAQRPVQTRGFNAFRYADIAASLSVSKASLHFHFPSKVDLGVSLIERYGDTFRMALEAIDLDSGGTAAKLRRYVGLYAAVLADEGRASGVLRFEGPAAEASQFIIDSLEGSMMMARSHGGMARFDAASRRLLAEFRI